MNAQPDPVVLAFNLDPIAFKGLEVLCEGIGLRAVSVPREAFHRPVGALAGLPIPEAEAAAGDGFQDAMLVMCGLDEQRFDTFLKALRASALPRIPLKAVLTPYNALWSAVQLHAELRREHEAMASGKAN